MKSLLFGGLLLLVPTTLPAQEERPVEQPSTGKPVAESANPTDEATDEAGTATTDEATDEAGTATTDESTDEATDDKAALVEQLDTNKDGAVQLDELPEDLRKRLKPLYERLKTDGITAKDLREVTARSGTATNDRGRIGYFDLLDANGDGELTVAEVPAEAKSLVAALLERVDLPRTGKLTRAAYDRFVAPKEVEPTEPATPETPMSRPGLLQILDADGDGRLSPTELARAAEKFDDLDTDASGFLDSREIVGSSADETTRNDAARDEALRRKIFGDLDKNHDGFISREESNTEDAQRLNDNFDKIDGTVDQRTDDRISFEEFSKAIANPNSGDAPPAE